MGLEVIKIMRQLYMAIPTLAKPVPINRGL